MGTIDLEVPRLRNGSYFPSFMEPNTRSERAIIALVQEAIISGVSTRKIHKLAAETRHHVDLEVGGERIFQGVGRGSVRVP